MNRGPTPMPSARAVLDRLLTHAGPQTRSELAVACGLSRPTVFAAVERLESLGLVESLGQRSGLPGRTATLYDVPVAAGCVAGIDIGGSNLRVAVCDVSGTPLAELTRPTQARGAESVVRQAVELLAEARVAAERAAVPLLAVGVSTPGAVDERTVRYAWNLGQETPYDLYSQLAAAIDGPVLLENNVNLAAIGEHRHGAGASLSTFAVIAIGAGVGAGIMHNGVLLRGAHGAAGEVGFLPTARARRGTPAEPDEAGGLALLREARALDPALRDVQDLFDRARAGDDRALSLVEDECLRIHEIVTALSAVVDPETVILTGGIGDNELLATRVAALAATLPVPINILRSTLAHRASLVGAIATATDHAHAQLLSRTETPHSSTG
ncbi:ROK family protein [Kribbella sandramycini]|uniref:Putative NBD/HSP70 family sugar kinase n=1 Tax=Kribbella sandramycini TaxID=60450 RepID=A0A7Y4L095_9ACTN|nr:ROK family transcriptional regulator [Kribbella sandramycini]MBB6565662.1 putative NBD/HSP70 family sugar kinase [Kribbella sandramycini]NOL41925.1 ROK family protein [Kribbella sandramycini]